jgi:hypothetical protein
MLLLAAEAVIWAGISGAGTLLLREIQRGR